MNIFAKRLSIAAAVGLAFSGWIGFAAKQRASGVDNALPAAAHYMDGRMDWWLHWPNAARDHDTTCVSCHTALPYALARPALRIALHESQSPAPEQQMIATVVKRVRLWNEVAPFYPDQTLGLPKTSESRGSEAVLNALILATRDAQTGSLSDDTRRAFANMWALQFKVGAATKGSWAWLNFHLEPWESTDSAYFGATLAAWAVATAPDRYAESAEIQEPLKLLRDYLQKGPAAERTFDRIMELWVSSKLAGLMTPAEKQAVVDTIRQKQHEDGGWSMADLGAWKRSDNTGQSPASDGYATGLATLALESARLANSEPLIQAGVHWLRTHQDPESGAWHAVSLNKERDPASDAGKFMSDAATAYAALARFK